MGRIGSGCAGVCAGWGDDRADPVAGAVREYVLRRGETESVVYDGEPVVVLGLSGRGWGWAGVELATDEHV